MWLLYDPLLEKIHKILYGNFTNRLGSHTLKGLTFSNGVSLNLTKSVGSNIPNYSRVLQGSSLKTVDDFEVDLTDALRLAKHVTVDIIKNADTQASLSALILYLPLRNE